MPVNKPAEKIPHSLPIDMAKTLKSNPKVAGIWDTLTPLAKNEWICWVTYYKKVETREKHLVRLKEDLLKGKRRPCCWQGCPHRPGHPKKIYTARKK
jgi:uncharacterized protein YdeI (YjbR/CyaY-like superfamily)